MLTFKLVLEFSYDLEYSNIDNTNLSIASCKSLLSDQVETICNYTCRSFISVLCNISKAIYSDVTLTVEAVLNV